MAALLVGAAVTLGSAALKGSGGGSPAGMQSMPFTSAFDDSGWTVNIGSGSASATATKTTANSPAAAMLMSNPLLIVAICFAIYYATKHK